MKREQILTGMAISVLLWLASCTNAPVKKRAESIKNEVVLIFKDAPDQTSSKKEFYGNSHRIPLEHIVFIDSSITICRYFPRNIGYDTLKVPAPGGTAEIKHIYMSYEDICFLGVAGDTILITYQSDNRPVIKSLVSDENTMFYHLPLSLNGAIVPKTGHSLVSTLTNDFQRMAHRYKKIEKSLPTDLEKRFAACYINLDSLALFYQTYNHRLQKKYDSLYQNHLLPENQYKFYTRLNSRDSVLIFRHLKTYKMPEEIFSYNDSLIYSLAYQEKVSGMAYRYCNKKPGRINPPAGFNLILNDSTLPPQTKKIMLRRVMEMITEGIIMQYTAPSDTIAKYTNLYISKYGKNEPLTVPVINRKNLVPNGYSNDLVLFNTTGEQMSYSAILKAHRGKVIYVDFWASWCGPCRAGMPEAKKLRENYKEKDIVFIFLAVNDRKEEWKRAIRQCETDYLGENYLVLPGENKFLKEIKQRYIPHFLLYDKTGSLVDLNAPRPSSKEIRKKINHLLQQ